VNCDPSKMFCASVNLERATARNFAGGFPNEKPFANHPVYAGDAGLGGGTTAWQCFAATRRTGHAPEFASAGRESIAAIDTAQC